MPRFALFFALVVAVAALAAFISARVVRSGAQVVDAHQWLHDQLKLSAVQDEKMAPAERKFLDERTRLIAEIQAANRDLAKAIQTDGRWSANVEAAIERGTRAQAELQRLTVRHCLEISDYLTPEQSKRYLELTAQILSRDSD